MFKYTRYVFYKVINMEDVQCLTATRQWSRKYNIQGENSYALHATCLSSAPWDRVDRSVARRVARRGVCTNKPAPDTDRGNPAYCVSCRIVLPVQDRLKCGSDAF